MIFNDHSELNGTHAFLSPSKHYWIGYSEDKLVESYFNAQAAQRGTETHQVVLVLLGAESAEFRGQAAELLLRYAQNALK